MSTTLVSFKILNNHSTATACYTHSYTYVVVAKFLVSFIGFLLHELMTMATEPSPSFEYTQVNSTAPMIFIISTTGSTLFFTV